MTSTSQVYWDMMTAQGVAARMNEATLVGATGGYWEVSVLQMHEPAQFSIVWTQVLDKSKDTK